MPHTLPAFPGTPVDWIKKIKANDDAAIGRLYVQTYPAVEHHILKNSGNADDAKDIFQEAFLAAWRNIQLDRFMPETPSSLSAYIFQIAKNKWIDQLRTSRRKNTTALADSLEPAEPAAGNEDAAEQDAYIEMVKNEFAHLGEQCRELLTKFYFQKQSMREIAASFSWTEASAKNNKYRCLQKLRSLVLKK